MYKILVVEDEKAISDLVTMSLELEEYQVEVAFDGEEGAKKIEEGSFDLALFDIMLPKYNGYDDDDDGNQDRDTEPQQQT